MCIYKSLIHHPLPVIINQENAGAGIMVPTYNRSYWEAPLLVGLLWAGTCPLWEFGRGVSDPDRRMDTLASDRSELLVNQPEISSWMSENLDKRRFQ